MATTLTTNGRHENKPVCLTAPMIRASRTIAAAEHRGERAAAPLISVLALSLGRHYGFAC
jgi:hypothetical protein